MSCRSRFIAISIATVIQQGQGGGAVKKKPLASEPIAERKINEASQTAPAAAANSGQDPVDHILESMGIPRGISNNPIPRWDVDNDGDGIPDSGTQAT